MQDHIKYTSEPLKKGFENQDHLYGVNYSFRNNKQEISLVKFPKIALNTFDDKRCYIDKFNSVP